ncbi:MAG: hypothetical protein CML04_00350 [Pseudozobellia sp.]|nr:hypothetical protein [Pseudozobellia sp.]MBG49025.1 hypothetical protein [Pseudozobellia sp.]|tara:strand:+ start:63889 stop:64983 length:1095 start_codon:yes stop_codon:yes gene_type:complete
MKRILPYKFLTLLLLLAPVLISANNGDFRGKHTKEKTIKKEFDVNSDVLLRVNNSYGNLNLTSWNENKIIIEVHIKTNGNNEERVIQKLNEIDVNFEASRNEVSAKTNFNNDNSSWGWNWGKKNNVNMQVDYTIKLPIKSNINLDNDYGSIILDRVDGHAKINCDYGRLDIGELRGRQNQLNFDYTSNSSFSYVNSAKISADYSGFKIEKAGDLVINADYTNSEIESMQNLEYSSDYGKIQVGEANNIYGRGDYINVQIGTVHGNLDITADYGSLKIDQMAEDAGNLLIKTDYTGVKIGYHPQYAFNFEIRTSYAGVSGKDDFDIQISEEKNNSKYYKGHYGSVSNGKNVSITSDYGGITFFKN